MDLQLLNEECLITSFGRHAKTYPLYAQLQQSMASKLANYLPSSLPENVLEIGCGTGHFTRHLLSLPTQNLILNDIASAMLKSLSETLILPNNAKLYSGNAERIQFHDIDLICANAVFQWFQEPLDTLKKLRQSLTNGGSIIFSTFGPKTLKEFRDIANIESPIEFHDHEAWIGMLKDAGFTLKTSDVEIRKLYYSNTLSFLQNLQQLGASPLRMTTTGKLRKILRDYDLNYSTQQGVYANWEIYYFSMVLD